MAIKHKSGGSYADIVGVFHKAGGVYSAVQGVFAKSSGAYASVGSLAITLDDDLFFDDFNATDTSLTGRAGWYAQGDSTRAGLIKADGGICRMMTSYNGQDPYGFQITTATPNESRRVEFEYDFTQQGAALDNASQPYKYFEQRYVVAWQDTNNHTFFNVVPASSRMTLYKVISGATTEIARYEGVPTAAIVAVEFRTDRYRVFINGEIWAPDQLFNDSDAAYPDRLFNGAVIKSGGIGIRHDFYAVAITKFVRANSRLVTINDLKTFYGRAANNKRSIAIGGAYTGAPVSWAYQLRRKSDGTVVAPWRALSATANAGSWSATVEISTGGPYYLDVGWTGADEKTRMATSSPFSVGILVCYWGQSLANGMGYAAGAFTDASALYNGYDNSLAHATSSYSRWWRTDEKPAQSGYFINALGVAKSLADSVGVPVGVAAVGVAATQLELLKPGTANWDNVLVPFVAEIGGNVECWVFSQGEAEGLSSSSYTNYAADFALTVAGFRDIGGRSDAGVFIRVIGKDTAVSNTAGNITRAQDVRSLLFGFENPANGIWVSSAVFGVALDDTIHPTNASHVLLGRRDGYSIASKKYAASSRDGKGPMVTSASRVGAVITLAVNLNGATGISGSSLSGYAVSNDDFVSTLTISSVTVTSDQIVITLSATPSGTVKVRSFREPNYDDSSLATGAYADGFSVPVFPIVNPITVS